MSRHQETTEREQLRPKDFCASEYLSTTSDCYENADREDSSQNMLKKHLTGNSSPINNDMFLKSVYVEHSFCESDLLEWVY